MTFSTTTTTTHKTAFKIAAIYTFFSFLWIAFSDQVLLSFVNNAILLTRIQMFKGWVFVFITAFIFYFLLYRELALVKQTEAYLRESEEKFRSLADTSPLAIIMTSGIEQVIEYINPATVKLFYYTHDEVPTVEQWWPLAYPDEDYRNRVIKEWQQRVEQAIATDSEIEPVETVVTCKDGSTKNVLWGFSAVGKQNWILGLDLTDRKKAEEKLLRAQTDLQNTFDISPGLICIANVNTGYFTKCNPAVLNILGYSEEEFKAKPILEFLHPDDRQRTTEEISKQLKGSSIANFQNRYQCKDGSYKWMSWGGTGTDEEGNVYAVATDITHLKEAEVESKRLAEDLKLKNAELERFIYTVSHDLKTPLVTIGGFCGVAKEDFASGNQEQGNRSLDIVSNAAKRMHQLLNELLHLSRVGIKINPSEIVNLEVLFEEAIRSISGVISANNTAIEIESELPDVMVDRQYFLQVIENLLTNASRYTKDATDGSKIKIGVTRNSEELICYVKDNGIGIEAQYLGKVFGLFEKLDTNSDSTGVGLAIVKRIIENHGGRIWAESDGLGHGTTFFFTLPEAA